MQPAQDNPFRVDPRMESILGSVATGGTAMPDPYETPAPTPGLNDGLDSETIKNETPRKPGLLEDYGVRGLLGGAEHGIIGFFDMFHDFGRSTSYAISDFFKSTFNVDYKVPLLDSKGYRLVSVDEYFKKDKEEVEKLQDFAKPVLIDDPVRGGAKMTRAITEFAVTFVPASEAMISLKAVEAFGAIGRVGSYMAASAVAAASSYDPAAGNLANLAEDLGVTKSAFAQAIHVDDLVSALSVDEGDDDMTARLKNAGADFAVGIVAEGAFRAIGKAAKTIKEARIAKKATEVTEAADGVAVTGEANAGKVAAHVEERIAAQEGAKPVLPEGPAGTQGELFPGLPNALADDVVDTVEKLYLDVNRKGAKLTEQEVKDIAEAFMKGDPYEALERMGVNPSRIDFGKFLADHATPEAAAQGVRELLERVASSEGGMRIAEAMGSKPRTDEAAAFLAKVVGSDVTKIVASFKDKTRNLDVYVRAASALVGGEAQKLYTLATTLRDLAAKGEWAPAMAEHPAYIEFLRQFETLTTLQAAIRGSFSEMGRGLRSIQQVNAARTAKADIELARSVIKDPAAQEAAKRTAQSWEEKLKALADAKTPAQRQALLDQVLKANGDLAQVAKNVTKAEGSLATKAFRWLRETSANLFSVGTFSATSMGMFAYQVSDLIAGSFSHPLALMTQNKDFIVAAAVNRARWGAILPAYVNAISRSVQVVGGSLIREAGRVADGAGSAGAGASGLASQLSAKWEATLGKVPVLKGDKFGKHVTGAVENKFERPDLPRDPAIYVKPETVDAWLTSDDHGPAVMAAGARAIVGMIVNGFGAATRAGRAVTIEFLDETTGAAVYAAYKWSEAVGLATRHGIAAGLSGKALAAHVDRMAKEMVSETSRSTATSLQNLIAAGSEDKAAIELLAKDVIERHGIEEIAQKDARRILFQDDLSTGIGRLAAKAAKWDEAGIIAPFVHTPLRIIETGLMDFSPLGLFKRQLRADLYSNGPAATEALARISMGTALLLMGWNMAASGKAVGYDGGTESSTRLQRPQYSILMGDKWVEYGRIDPLATAIGIGVDLQQFWQAAAERDPSGSRFDLERLAEAGVSTLIQNVLSKSYLQGLKNFAELGDLRTRDHGFVQIMNGLLQRLVPMGGIQKGLTGEASDEMLQVTDAANVWHQLKDQYVSSWAFGPLLLESRRDPFLGKPVHYDRTLGIKVGDHEDDPLRRELAKLAFNFPPDPKTLQGLRLDHHQHERLLELLGDAKVGERDLSEALRDQIASPGWSDLSIPERVQVVRAIRAQYYQNAVALLLEEDKGLWVRTLASRRTRALQQLGLPDDQIRSDVEQFKAELFAL